MEEVTAWLDWKALVHSGSQKSVCSAHFSEEIKSQETSRDLSRYHRNRSREKSLESNHSREKSQESKFYKQSKEKSQGPNQSREKSLESPKSMRDSCIRNRSSSPFQSQRKESEEVTQSSQVNCKFLFTCEIVAVYTQIHAVLKKHAE